MRVRFTGPGPAFYSGLYTARALAASEPMYYNASHEFLMTQPDNNLTKSFLEALFRAIPRFKDDNLVVDSRTQMLMPGMYPAIPGWHCDDVPRRDADGQPDLAQMSGELRHAVMYLSTSEAGPATEFLAVPLEVKLSRHKPNVWARVHKKVEKAGPWKFKAQPGQIYVFSDRALHRAMPATERCWRWFIRASIMRGPRQHSNEVRRQVQVYTTEGGGW